MRVVNRYLVAVVVLIYAIIIIYLASTTPLIPAEAKILYTPSYTISHYLASISHSFIDGVIGLRIGFVVVSLVDIYLFYLMIKDRFANYHDRVATLILFISLPGMIASSVLVSDSPFAILFTILSILAIINHRYILATLSMFSLLFTNTAVFSFYLAIALYALSIKDKKSKNRLFIISFFLFALSIIIGHYPISGKPQGHFLELLGIYSAVFSPLLFIYYFYSLYRSFLENRVDIIWYVSSVALIVSLLLSIRQKVHITDFSPYLLIGIPIAVEVYLRSLRVRMRRFQFKYRLAMYIVIFSLSISSLVLILNKPLYYISKDRYTLFITPVYRVYERAMGIISSGKSCYDKFEFPSKYRYVVKFYGLDKECKE